jgi:hypothetical protein
VGSLTSHSPIGLHGLLGDSFAFLYIYIYIYKLDLVGVQEVRWGGGDGTEPAGEYTFFYKGERES